ncbi:MAG: branched-chain alpha-keto acid dehydrogenase subunit E2 [Acidobacteria bacterium]|nr:MAG: branched-chain alpha-keto acid dehydrogenase subunit E2 [Acidobacteriota bacterium]REK00131.1 MAG: branched-chain alpha-keto acid dehydrogenase subunit E2 [Acidobacteriota bacterium]
MEVRVPDIGDFDKVEVIEVLVEVGQEISAEDSLITLESDKASMEVPSPSGGVVRSIAVSIGDEVAEGDLILELEAGEAGGDGAEEEDSRAEGSDEGHEGDEGGEGESTRETAGGGEEPDDRRSEEPSAAARSSKGEPAPGVASVERDEDERPPAPAPPIAKGSAADLPHASPGVRRFARQLGVDLSRVEGSGAKGRILQEDVQQYVKRSLSGAPRDATPSAGAGIPPVPAVDFSKFGEVEEVPLSRIRKLSAASLHRSWLNVPHVTQFDEADITELEEFRAAMKPVAEKRGVKLTPLAFLLKAAAATLADFPDFNSSLHPEGDRLIRKHYFHLGVAVDTDNGLVVPVIRDVDRKGVLELAAELGEVSSRARDGKLRPADIQGATFTISSLGGIGGTGFTPIVNAPEVAILGVARSKMQPVYRDDAGEGGFVPRLILPFSVSYDHRVIDGAEAVRFTTALAAVLTDIRRLVL